jgi:cell division protein ZapA
MALAIVTIAGRTYRMGCDEGQEKRLEELAAIVDAKIAEMRENFGEIGDQRIVVMAALQIADEVADARGRIAALETQVAALRAQNDESRRRDAAVEARLEQTFGNAAARLEQLARDLSRKEGEKDAALSDLPGKL